MKRFLLLLLVTVFCASCGGKDRRPHIVLVMADDDAVRRNRLALLAELRGVFLNIADVSCLSIG